MATSGEENIFKKKPELIAFIGVKGSGKTYLGDQYLARGYKPIDFKDDLMQMCWDILGYKPKDYEKFKQCIIGLDFLPIKFSEALVGLFEKLGLPPLMTGRRLLQRVGSEAIRKRQPMFWAGQMYRDSQKTLEAGFNVVNRDGRFANELQVMGSLSNIADVKFIFCDYKSSRYDATDGHVSEHLAQYAVSLAPKYNLKHGDIIPLEMLRELMHYEKVG